MANTEIALIGTGSISHYHVPVLEDVGMNVNAVASMNPESNTIEEFGKKFNIDNTFRGESWRDMISNGQWDGIVIATHISGTPEALECCLATGVPILVEKPVSWSSETIRRLREDAHKNIIVGYNRRYYKPVQKAKDFLTEHRPVMATIELPAASDIKSFIGMSSHGIDILRYLFGELNVLSTYELTDGESLNGYTAILQSDSGDLINVIGNWEASSNVGLNIDYQDVRFQIKPYEQAQIYEGLDIKEPTEEMPIRRYVPVEEEKINMEFENTEYKPGFYKQALSYQRLIQEGESSEHSATLYDAEKALELCETLLPDRFPIEGQDE